jgi:hypothetical protein
LNIALEPGICQPLSACQARNPLAPGVFAAFQQAAMVTQEGSEGGHWCCAGAADIGEQLAPCDSRAKIGRDNHRGAFVESTDGVEQQLVADLGERQETELVGTR